MRKILSMARKDLRLLLRDPAGTFFTFFFPLLFAIFFGSILGGAGSGSGVIGVVVVDLDRSEGSREFLGDLGENEGIRIDEASREEAIDLVRRGKRVAYLIVPEGFGQSRDPFFGPAPPEIEMGIDPARRAAAAMLEGVMNRTVFRQIEKTFQDRDRLRDRVRRARLGRALSGPSEEGERLDRLLGAFDEYLQKEEGGESSPTIAWNLTTIRKTEVEAGKGRPTNIFSISFPQAIVWGIFGCIATFAISLVTERSRGTLLRLRTAPISRVDILAGKGIACLATTVTMSSMLLALGAAFFEVRPSSIPLLALAIVSVSIGFVGIMMFLSVLGKTEAAAGGMGWAILMVLAMMGGGMLPLFLMPAWMEPVSHASPVKWAILALEGPIWRGLSLPEMLLPCGILLGIGVFFFAIGAAAFRWTEEA